jgi:hypothetical protein
LSRRLLKSRIQIAKSVSPERQPNQFFILIQPLLNNFILLIEKFTTTGKKTIQQLLKPTFNFSLDHLVDGAGFDPFHFDFLKRIGRFAPFGTVSNGFGFSDQSPFDFEIFELIDLKSNRTRYLPACQGVRAGEGNCPARRN